MLQGQGVLEGAATASGGQSAGTEAAETLPTQTQAGGGAEPQPSRTHRLRRSGRSSCQPGCCLAQARCGSGTAAGTAAAPGSPRTGGLPQVERGVSRNHPFLIVTKSSVIFYSHCSSLQAI